MRPQLHDSISRLESPVTRSEYGRCLAQERLKLGDQMRLIVEPVVESKCRPVDRRAAPDGPDSVAAMRTTRNERTNGRSGRSSETSLKVWNRIADSVSREGADQGGGRNSTDQILSNGAEGAMLRR